MPHGGLGGAGTGKFKGQGRCEDFSFDQADLACDDAPFRRVALLHCWQAGLLKV